MKFWLLLLLSPVLAGFVPTFSRENIVEITCKDNIPPSMLLNESTVFFCTNNHHMIYHSSKLDTLMASNKAVSFYETPSKYSNSWVEVETNKYAEVTQDGGIPYTGCLSLENGDEGALSGTVSDSFGVAASLDFGYALINAAVATINLGLSGSLGLSQTISTEFYCRGKAGQTVQLTIVPAYYKFREGKYRFLTLEPKKKLRVEHGGWDDIPDTQVLAGTPMIKCVTDPELLQCHWDSGLINARK